MISANGLSKSYGGPDLALKQATFEIGANEVVGLLGPNGAGKTTLMKILAGFMHPNTGTATIDSIDVVEDPHAVQQRIGYLPENAPIYDEMLVQEYLLMMADLRRVAKNTQHELVADAVRRTSLEEYLVRPISELSKGYRQRVGLAQAILHRPKVLILDEPTSGLDPNQIVEIRKLIRALAENATVLLSTHILPEVELTCERVLIISGGELREDARLDELRAGTAAVVAAAGKRGEIREALKGLDGVEKVTTLRKDDEEGANGFNAFRVAYEGEDDLCPQIFDLAKEQGWRLAELRPDRMTLESVFQRVVQGSPDTRRRGAA